MAVIVDIISEWAVYGIEFLIFIFTFNLFFELKDRRKGFTVVIGILYYLIDRDTVGWGQSVVYSVERVQC